MDKHTPEQRSYNMAQVKSKNTKPELVVIEMIKHLNEPFETQYAIHGKPDIAFPKKKVAVFVNGEFWHGRHFTELSKIISDFWKMKIGGNIKRDRKNKALLKKDGWKTVTIWDKDLKKNPNAQLNKIKRALKTNG